jgi:hypothetical protein
VLLVTVVIPFELVLFKNQKIWFVLACFYTIRVCVEKVMAQCGCHCGVESSRSSASATYPILRDIGMSPLVISLTNASSG